MTTPNLDLNETTSPDCFLCTLDTHPCDVKQLEGRIVAANQFKTDGELLPYITVDTGSSLATVRLAQTYNSLAKQLLELGTNLRRLRLLLRVYHLPQAISTTEHKGQALSRYIANELTLAILEPDTILNITDLNSAEYCARQYLLNRLLPAPQSPAAIRGNMVHSSFKELLKEHDRGELMQGHVANGEETPLATLQRHFKQALQRGSIDLAISNISAESIRSDVAPHLESLAIWFEKQHATLWDMPEQIVARANGDEGRETDQSSIPLVRAETFLLAPEIGLRGRLDLLWRQRSRQRLLELKTGGGNGRSAEIGASLAGARLPGAAGRAARSENEECPGNPALQRHAGRSHRFQSAFHHQSIAACHRNAQHTRTQPRDGHSIAPTRAGALHKMRHARYMRAGLLPAGLAATAS